MDLLLGLDVGTTATKAVLFDLEGNARSSASYRYDLITPRQGWVEQNPEDLWRGVVATTQSVLREVATGDRVVALCQSSQGGTTIPVDAGGTPTHNAISWMDQRAGEQARRVREQWGAEFIRTTTGWALQDGLPLQHVAWFRQNCPDEYARTRQFLFVNDFVMQRLAGLRRMNPSDASITQLADVATGDWDERLLGIAGLSRDTLSPIRPSGYAVGTVSADASEATGLSREVVVVNGAHDQYCAAVGTGVVRPGPVLLSCGTAWVVLAVPQSLRLGLHSGMAVSCHAVEGRWGVIRSLGGVGASVEWLLDNVWDRPPGSDRHRSLYDALNEGAARVPAGAEGLLFFPIAGARDAATAGFVGLSLAHSRDHMARAAMEGVAFELRLALEEMEEAGLRVSEWKMVGGAAESAVWPQIVADVTGTSVILPACKQAACRGAAVLAAVGGGLFADLGVAIAALEGPEARLEPAPGNRESYDDRFAAYQRLARRLAGPESIHAE